MPLPKTDLRLPVRSEIQLRFATISSPPSSLTQQIIRYITGTRVKEERIAIDDAITILETCYTAANNVQMEGIRAEDAIKNAEVWLLMFRKSTKHHKELSRREQEDLVRR